MHAVEFERVYVVGTYATVCGSRLQGPLCENLEKQCHSYLTERHRSTVSGLGKLFIGLLHTRTHDGRTCRCCSREGDVMTARVRACHSHSSASAFDSLFLKLASYPNASSHICVHSSCVCCVFCAVVMATATACRVFVVYADRGMYWSSRSVLVS